MLNRASKRYLGILSVTIVVALTFVLALNMAVDPLWYLRGNVVTGKNFAFNERTAKMNRFLASDRDYDCIIFGSSRTTLLNEYEIEGHDCFNFAFSAGRIEEFVHFAEYLRDRGYAPKYLIVGVDADNFFPMKDEPVVPDFVLTNDSPPWMMVTYLTKDALNMSIRTLRGKSLLPRYYRSDFTASILPDTPPYRPEEATADEFGEIGLEIEGRPRFGAGDRTRYETTLETYRALTRVFPDADIDFYVPPISIWLISEYAHREELDDYLFVIHSVSRLGYDLYDFSVPSELTRDIGRTYDGSHFDPEANHLVAMALNTGNPKVGVNVRGLTFAEYRHHFAACTRTAVRAVPCAE